MKTHCSVTLLESALAGQLPAGDETILHEHLESCEQCSEALDRMAGGAAWCREAASLLAEDELDAAAPTRDEWSEIDFTVEHLEPSDEPGVLGRLGGYDVLEIIGHGGMGVVLKAFDRELKRTVAIKVLAPHLARNSLARKRFAREAQAAAAVVHPHVLAIHQVQAGGRLPFLVMPLVAGESLAERLTAQGTLELKETLRIGLQAAAGLAAAHEQGLVHRDVKPANILLERGVERTVLTDFGLARAADDVTLTRWGVVAGTPQYMSPEQARGEPLDARSDLFSLGCVLYEMSTGVSPFRTDSVMATMRRLIEDSPQAMESLNPELPPWFIAIVERLLEKDPARRFNSAAEVSDLLENCLAHVQRPAAVPLPEQLRNYPSSTRAKRARWSMRKLIACAALAPSFLLAGVVILLELNKGTLTIESEADDVSLRITQGDKVVDNLTVSRDGKKVRIAAGIYRVEIDGEADGIAVENGTVSIERKGAKVVRIIRGGAELVAQHEMSFGPTINQTMHCSGRRFGNDALRLEDGKLFNLPKTFTFLNETKDAMPLEAQRRWLDESRINFAIDYLKVTDRWEMQLHGVKFADVSDDSWKTMSANDLRDRIPTLRWKKGAAAERDGFASLMFTEGMNPPMTFAFETSSGHRGLFQFYGYHEANNLRAVIIRYKLLQQSAELALDKAAGSTTLSGSGSKPPLPPSDSAAGDEPPPLLPEIPPPTAPGPARASPDVPPQPGVGDAVAPTVPSPIKASKTRGPGGLGFSDITEVVLSQSTGVFLDLDTGQTIGESQTPRPEERPMDIRVMQDQTFYDPTGLTGRALQGMKVNPRDWDAPAADVSRAFANKANPRLTRMDFTPSEPATYFFKTRDGAEGVLQLVELVQNPKGLRVRYKTVRLTSDEPPAALSDSAARIATELATRIESLKSKFPHLKKFAADEHLRKNTEKAGFAPGTASNPELYSISYQNGAVVAEVPKAAPRRSPRYMYDPETGIQLDVHFFTGNSRGNDLSPAYRIGELGVHVYVKGPAAEPIRREIDQWLKQIGAVQGPWAHTTETSPAPLLPAHPPSNNPDGNPGHPMAPTAPDPPPSNDRPENAAGFSEAKELVLSMNSSKFMLDLDTGETMDPPARIRPEQAKMDLSTTQVQPYHYPTGLIGHSLQGKEAKPGDWNASVADVQRALAGNIYLLKEMDVGPEKNPTYFFKTRDGALGILQLVEVTDEPKGIRLRYKTVLRGSAAEKSAGKVNSVADETRSPKSPSTSPEPDRGAPPSSQKASVIELRLGYRETRPGLVEMNIAAGDEKVYVSPHSIATDADIAGAEVVGDPGAQHAIQFTFKDEATKRLTAATQQHLGSPLAVLVEGKVLTAPIVRDALGNKAMISGFTLAEAKRIAAMVSSMPKPAHFQTLDNVNRIATSADGKLIAVANGNPTFILMTDGTSRVKDNWKPWVEILDANTGASVRVISPEFSPTVSAVLEATRQVKHIEVTALAFSPVEEVIAVGTSIGQVQLFNSRTGMLLNLLDDKEPRLADKETPENWKPLQRAMGSVTSISYSPDGSLLAVCGNSFEDFSDVFDGIEQLRRRSTAPGRLKVFAVKTGALKHDLAGHSHAFDVAFSTDGSLLASAGRWDGGNDPGNGVLVWNPQTGEKMRTILIEANGGTHRVAFSPNKKLIATGSEHYDKENDTSSTSIAVTYPLSGITEWQRVVPGWSKLEFVPDGTALAVLSGGQSIQYLDVSTGQTKQEAAAPLAPPGARLNDFAVAHKGRKLAVGGIDANRSGLVFVWPMGEGSAASP